MGNLNNYIVKIKEKYSGYLNNPEILKLNLSEASNQLAYTFGEVLLLRVL